MLYWDITKQTLHAQKSLPSQFWFLEFECCSEDGRGALKWQTMHYCGCSVDGALFLSTRASWVCNSNFYYNSIGQWFKNVSNTQFFPRTVALFTEEWFYHHLFQLFYHLPFFEGSIHFLACPTDHLCLYQPGSARVAYEWSRLSSLKELIDILGPYGLMSIP